MHVVLSLMLVGSAPLVTPPTQQSRTLSIKGLGEAMGSAPLVTPPTIASPWLDENCGSRSCEGVVQQY
eukprot:11629419-Karenia_brevis.AAC.1